MMHRTLLQYLPRECLWIIERTTEIVSAGIDAGGATSSTEQIQ